MHTSWLGRINVIKMNVLPRLLYLFQYLPTPIPVVDIKLMQRAVLAFVWKGKQLRVPHTLLMFPRDRGALLVLISWTIIGLLIFAMYLNGLCEKARKTRFTWTERSLVIRYGTWLGSLGNTDLVVRT